MKTKVFIAIAWRIIVFFGTAMLTTFITPNIRTFLGDKPHVHDAACNKHSLGCTETIDVMFEWGARHYWYIWMLFFLFILALINSVVAIMNVINKNYPNL